ncbi:glycosyl transferase family protein [Sphingorhabdus pulchriflava]|uniref:Glycosyl transferase family protein n=1 Tax=Sphingorhabdus pulchriflava TaxID=2292257 RepID=A0A371B2U0_9SPHN|nr:glycosyl transferase family protein [Sphingorhabdus pulchriflava]RDV01773.1 glycosyl transferase family protein [Sphingorhabdus pulchriflava]
MATAPTIWTLFEYWQHELLLFCAIFFLIGALDDLCVDLVWALHRTGRWLARYRIAPPIRASQLPPPTTPGLIAIFIATWQEASVIEAMLRQCQQAWGTGKTEYRIYVGCYPNDRRGAAAIMRGCSGHPQCRLVLCDLPGPTSKADCLNRLWHALLSDELVAGMKAKAIVLHDAEDSVHPHELRVFDYLIEKASAVQLPVIAIPVAHSNWVSGHYCDEFAEAHGKQLVVREAIGAAVPLAGVGCAIERNHLGRIALRNGGSPFDATSLTEDYELGLGVTEAGARTIFARILDEDGQLVGTRACFPDTLGAAVRQKARWMTGIALAGWDRLGWRGSAFEYWMRLRDRKAVFAALVLTLAYACIALTALLILAHRSGVHDPKPLSSTLVLLLLINAVLLMWRMAVRCAFVSRQYGWRQGLLSIPRTVVANIIAIMAARRATFVYARHLLGGKLQWDKTTHAHFPSSG